MIIFLAISSAVFAQTPSPSPPYPLPTPTPCPFGVPCNDGNPNTCPDYVQMVDGKCICAGTVPPPKPCGSPFTAPGCTPPDVEGKCVDNQPEYPTCDCTSTFENSCTDLQGNTGKCDTECNCVPPRYLPPLEEEPILGPPYFQDREVPTTCAQVNRIVSRTMRCIMERCYPTYNPETQEFQILVNLRCKF